MYDLTGSKLFSYVSGLIYLTIMNFIIVNGFAVLMEDMFSFTAVLFMLFRFPVMLVTLVVMFGLSYWLTPTVGQVSKDAKKIKKHTTIILYTVFALVLFIYQHYGDWLFS